MSIRSWARAAFLTFAWAPLLTLAAPCSPEDFKTRVAGQGECLVIAAFGDAAAMATPKTLIVWLHGDTSGGGPARSHVKPAQEAAVRYEHAGVLSIAMWRPGYADAEGHVSDGDNHGRSDNYTAANMHVVGDAIDRLKQHYQPQRVIVVGHSGGAATTANLLGMRPGLMDAAVLVSCPCDLRAWRAGRRWWPRSEDPANWVSKVAPPVKVVALTGSVDDNTSPALAQGYVSKLTEHKVDARFIGLAGEDHNSALASPEVITAIGSLLD